MDVGTVERGILVRVDGEGKITIQHVGLNPVECMGLLAMAEGYLMDDLKLSEKRKAADDALIEALHKAKVN